MATAAYINPALNTTKLDTYMGGRVVSGNTVYRVPDNNSASGFNSKAAYDTMMALDAWIHANIQFATLAIPLEIWAHSRGTSIALRWMRERQAAFLAMGYDPRLIAWKLSGSPETPLTGAVMLWPHLDKPVYPGDGSKCNSLGGPHDSTCPSPLEWHGGAGVGYGAPNPCIWYIDWIVNEWDGWAHCPAGYASVPSMDESITIFGIDIRSPWFKPGKILARMRNKEGYHAADDHYQQNPYDAAIPKVTYQYTSTQRIIYIMKYPMPYAVPQKNIRYKARAIDQKMRPIWKAAYTNMPSGIVIPNPDYANLPSLIPWKP